MSGGVHLPEGCQFYIYPKHRVCFRGRWVRLGTLEAEMLLLLMSRPGRVFSTLEIASEVYWYRDDGGPNWTRTVIPKQLWDVRQKFTKAGINLQLKSPFTRRGFVYRGMELLEQEHLLAAE